MFVRTLYNNLKSDLEPNKVLLVYGPRRVGKTTLIQQFAKDFDGAVQMLDGEDRNIQEVFSSQRVQTLKSFIGNTDLLILDEAQKIPDIGLNLKLIVDHFPGMRVIASGSASFSLAHEVGEPLTGRKKTHHLFPVSLRELMDHYGFEHHPSLTRDTLMIFGGYPEIFRLSDPQKQDYLKEVTESYLFRDILQMEDIRNPKKLRDLLILLAFQIGNEVSLSELGSQLGLHKDTVFRYLDLLEKSFVILNIRGFSRNLRKEITKSSRYYFYDNGIRNALINNFNTLSLRNDVGALWENFLVMERLKKQHYEGFNANNYFWRTYTQDEVDWVEERDGSLFGYEMKWASKSVRPPRAWTAAYPDASFRSISFENYLDFI